MLKINSFTKRTTPIKITIIKTKVTSKTINFLEIFYLIYSQNNKNYSNNQYAPKRQNRNPIQQQYMDPATQYALVYRAEMYILVKYPYLIDLNKK